MLSKVKGIGHAKKQTPKKTRTQGNFLEFQVFFKNTRLAVVRSCSSKEVFLKISQKDTCVGVSPCNFIKKRLHRRCFPMKFAKLLRTPFFT